MATWLYRHGFRCHHVTFVLGPSGGRDYRCERWLHLGRDHR